MYHPSNRNTRVLDPPTHSHQFDTNIVKIQYVSDPKTNMPSFYLILRLCDALDGVFSVFFFLGCMVVININVLFAEWRITERDYFQILLLGLVSGMEPTIFINFQIYIDAAVTTTFHVLVNTQLPLPQLIVLKALVHLIIHLVIFNNFLVFNFPFLILNYSFLSPDKYSLLIFDVVLHYEKMPLEFLKWSSATTVLS